MLEHKFRVGQVMNFTPHRTVDPGSRGRYTIVRLLPIEGRVLQYRVRSSTDGHERVVQEILRERDDMLAMLGRHPSEDASSQLRAEQSRVLEAARNEAREIVKAAHLEARSIIGLANQRVEVARVSQEAATGAYGRDASSDDTLIDPASSHSDGPSVASSWLPPTYLETTPQQDEGPDHAPHNGHHPPAASPFAPVSTTPTNGEGMTEDLRAPAPGGPFSDRGPEVDRSPLALPPPTGPPIIRLDGSTGASPMPSTTPTAPIRPGRRLRRRMSTHDRRPN